MSDESTPEPDRERKPRRTGPAAGPRGQRGSGAPRGDRKPYEGKKPYERKPADGKKPFDRKPADGKKPYERKPADGKKPFDRKPTDGKRPYTRGPVDGKRPYAGASEGARPPRPREDDRPRHDDPPIPDDVAANQLDRGARQELKPLTKENADWVARHLVMAARLLEEDPALAHKHALAAARRAGRIGVVRETTAITAYETGDFALALRELRTYRRITGRDDQLPLMVDSERGVGRPQAALELGRSVPRASLDVPVQVALAIAMSGARLDLGQPELALTELQIPQLDPERAFSYSPALFDAYATVLEELGRTDEAEQWWQRSDRATIALEQAAIPEGQDTVEIIEEFLDDEPGTEA
ncbi:hypothetical protein [Protaetiibacter larvae]|uniref:hypothetical protein n=1 Tax=Protaetiibacter larvae TaxID=2592654 RepID=UPI001FEA1A48|nr:hypothetical protein [Protaetiibacter larvae]